MGQKSLSITHFGSPHFLKSKWHAQLKICTPLLIHAAGEMRKKSNTDTQGSFHISVISPEIAHKVTIILLPLNTGPSGAYMCEKD